MKLSIKNIADEPRECQGLLFVLLFIIFFIIFLIPLRDTDFGWHYRCGEMIVRAGILCQKNFFSSLLANYNWYSPSHGYQILIYFIYSNFSYRGLTILYAVLSGLFYCLFIKSLRINAYIASILLFIGFKLSWSIFDLGFRSQIITVFMYCTTLAVINFAKANKKFLLILIPLMVVWANSHSGFFVGNITITVVLFTNIVKKYLAEKKIDFMEIIVLVLANLAVLINPYGYKVFWEVLRHFNADLGSQIAEWLPLNFYFFMLVLFVGAITLILFFEFKGKDYYKVILLAIFLLFSLKAQRNLPLFFISCLFCLDIEGMQKVLSGLKTRTNFVLAAFLIIPTLAISPARINGFLKSRNYCESAIQNIPCEAVDYIKNQEPGNIFNTYEWGGYFIWKLPKFKVFVDGRMPSWDTKEETKLIDGYRGNGPYLIYLQVLQNREGWQEVLKAYGIKYIFIQKGTFMDILLKNEPEKYGYREIYRDYRSVIYKRS